MAEWSENGFSTSVEANYSESMTIYDILCYSKDDCSLSGNYCPVNMLKGTVKSSGVGSNMFQKAADGFNGKRKADEEFPANLKFMFDENILDYMHFETIFL